jgi:acyl carrier protein
LDKQARILEEVTTLLRDIFAQDDLVVTPATTAVDVPGWDSMKQIEIVIAAEEKYGIRLKAREVDAMRSVRDLISLIDAKTSCT